MFKGDRRPSLRSEARTHQESMHRFALFATLAFAAWPVAYSNNPENQPIVEVSLAPPEKCLNLERQSVRRSPKVFDGVRRPLPEVAAEIALLDAEREKLEARGTDLVQSAAAKQ